jgi:hypothetical protein
MKDHQFYSKMLSEDAKQLIQWLYEHELSEREKFIANYLPANDSVSFVLSGFVHTMAKPELLQTRRFFRYTWLMDNDQHQKVIDDYMMAYPFKRMTKTIFNRDFSNFLFSKTVPAVFFFGSFILSAITLFQIGVLDRYYTFLMSWIFSMAIYFLWLQNIQKRIIMQFFTRGQTHDLPLKIFNKDFLINPFATGDISSENIFTEAGKYIELDAFESLPDKFLENLEHKTADVKSIEGCVFELKAHLLRSEASQNYVFEDPHPSAYFVDFINQFIEQKQSAFYSGSHTEALQSQFNTKKSKSAHKVL